MMDYREGLAEKGKMKRALAIHDLSGVGKCSLTVAMPILSAAGVECSAMPTAVLSTHTGGFGEVVCQDLTAAMLPFAHHWMRERVSFDARCTADISPRTSSWGLSRRCSGCSVGEGPLSLWCWWIP